jgi:hypothetical protein
VGKVLVTSVVSVKKACCCGNLAGKKYIDLALFLAALSDNRVEECGPEKTSGSVGILDPHMSGGRP